MEKALAKKHGPGDRYIFTLSTRFSCRLAVDYSGKSGRRYLKTHTRLVSLQDYSNNPAIVRDRLVQYEGCGVR